MIRFAVLESAAFHAEYDKAFVIQKFSSDVDKEAFRERLFSVRSAIVDALEQKWTSPDDFETAWDFDYCYHLCGGIYSERIFGAEYIRTVLTTLEKADSERPWTYHTVCEIVSEDCVVEDFGEMFFRSGVCFINAGEMTIDHRRRLGCPDEADQP